MMCLITTIVKTGALMLKQFSIALTLLALVGAAPMLAACQTTAGAGRDLSNGGKDLTHAAERNAPAGDRR
jgi:predicted small secreted protein